jgi:hypothetical protein
VSKAAYLAKDPVKAAREVADSAREVPIPPRDAADQATDFSESSLSFFLHPKQPGREEEDFLAPSLSSQRQLGAIKRLRKEEKNIAQRVKDANAKVQSFAKVRRTKHRPWEGCYHLYHFCK